MSSTMPPRPPPDSIVYRFEAGNNLVSTTQEPKFLHINGINNNMYNTDHGPKLVSWVNKNYQHKNLSGGKRRNRKSKSRKSKSRKSKSRKSKSRKTIRRRRK